MTAENHLKIIMDEQQQMLLSNFDLQSFMQSVCDRMCILTNADGSTIEMIEGSYMVYSAASGTLITHQGMRLHINSSLSGMSVTERKILYSSDTEHDDRVNKEATRKVGARSMVCVPLFESSKAVGVLKVISSRPDAFSSRDIETLQLLSIALGAELGKQINYDEKKRILREYEDLLVQLRSEIERRQELEKELINLTERDTLTGLLNRRGFSSQMQQWINRANNNDLRFGVFYLDLNKFKACNDTYGHEIGDLVLKEFSNRIKLAVRESDLIARFGGDEFVLAVWLTNSPDSLLQIANCIIEQLETSMCFRDLVISMTTSIGCTLWSQGKTEFDLIRTADQSMYLAKSKGSNLIAIDGELAG